jgi:Phenylacetic acid degradation B
VHVWDVLGKRSERDELVVVGGVKAPDVDMALLLARETHFRHKEGVAYAVRRRGDGEIVPGPYGAELLGGLTDRSYRRQEAYAGVGGKLKRVSAEIAKRGLAIDRPRPPVGRAPSPPAEPGKPPAGPPPKGGLSPEDLAAQGTAG